MGGTAEDTEAGIFYISWQVPRWLGDLLVNETFSWSKVQEKSNDG